MSLVVPLMVFINNLDYNFKINLDYIYLVILLRIYLLVKSNLVVILPTILLKWYQNYNLHKLSFKVKLFFTLSNSTKKKKYIFFFIDLVLFLKSNLKNNKRTILMHFSTEQKNNFTNEKDIWIEQEEIKVIN